MQVPSFLSFFCMFLYLSLRFHFSTVLVSLGIRAAKMVSVIDRFSGLFKVHVNCLGFYELCDDFVS